MCFPAIAKVLVILSYMSVVVFTEVTHRNVSTKKEMQRKLEIFGKGVSGEGEEEVYIFVRTPHPAARYSDWKR